MIRRFLISSLLIALVFTCKHTQVFAQESSAQFETSYNIDYSVNKTGETQVTQDITITNKQSDVIATTYTLTVRQIEIYDLEAFNKKEKLKTEVTNDTDVTTVKVIFDKEVIGEGRKNNFKIRFKSKDIANKLGEIWNVNFPKAQISDATTDYNITLSIPVDFGPEVYISPTPDKTQKTTNALLYTFAKDNLQNRGITASFGKYQLMNFQLKYQLSNASNFVATQEIALPPDIIGSQQVSFDKITPKPASFYVDGDGNYIATIKLGPKEKLTAEIIGTARLTGKQINPNQGGRLTDIPKSLIKSYTLPQKYWDVKSPKVQEIAQQLFNKDNTVTQNAFAAYSYVVKNLKYDFDLVKKDFIERKGAEIALTTDAKWACMEFTDSFIAITRAMGIPARELNGYAIASDKSNTPLSITLKGGDLLHSWAEFYDPTLGWIQVDPTWGNTSGIDYFTKLDTSHFVFSIKGLDSEIPLPAGSYKFPDTNDKLISVDFAQNPNTTDFQETLYLYKDIGWNPLKKLMGQQKYILSNQGHTAVLNVNGTNKVLLPSTYMTLYLKDGTTRISFVDINGNEISKDLEIKPGKPEGYINEVGLKLILISAGILLLVIATIFIYDLVHNKRIRPYRSFKFKR